MHVPRRRPPSAAADRLQRVTSLRHDARTKLMTSCRLVSSVGDWLSGPAVLGARVAALQAEAEVVEAVDGVGFVVTGVRARPSGPLRAHLHEGLTAGQVDTHFTQHEL